MRDRQTTVLLFVLVTVLACTGYVAYTRTQRRDLAVLMPRLERAEPRRFRAVVVFQPEDCNGRIGFMHAFSRPRWRNAFSTDALVIGSPLEAEAAAQSLRAQGLPMPVSAVRHDQHPGRFLGYAQTPYLLVLDRQDRLRIAVPGPSTTQELLALERVTEGLLQPAPAQR
ncbi:MAG TPA: hypothetical protein VGX50_16645 [Longimicrobium sp.]|jgi:NAD(P)H-flavin reductase|nr:hypothetical protein [Longimicrobium sp.]